MRLDPLCTLGRHAPRDAIRLVLTLLWAIALPRSSSDGSSRSAPAGLRLARALDGRDKRGTGALRPLQSTYIGKFLTAYLILFLVYGGGTAALTPLMKDLPPVPLSTMLAVWSVLCLVLAPI